MGLFGVTYTVGPTKAVPTAEVTPQPDDPALPRMPSHVHPVRPRWSDFEIDGLPLHDACEEFLDKAGDLVRMAREIAGRVHGWLGNHAAGAGASSYEGTIPRPPVRGMKICSRHYPVPGVSP